MSASTRATAPPVPGVQASVTNSYNCITQFGEGSTQSGSSSMHMPTRITALETHLAKCLGVRFNSRGLLWDSNIFPDTDVAAGTTRPACTEFNRFVWVGVKTLSLSLSMLVLRDCPHADSTADLTQLYGRFISNDYLANRFIQLSLERFAFMLSTTDGAEYAKAVEALVGGIFIDKGFDTAFAFIEAHLYEIQSNSISVNVTPQTFRTSPNNMNTNTISSSTDPVCKVTGGIASDTFRKQEEGGGIGDRVNVTRGNQSISNESLSNGSIESGNGSNADVSNNQNDCVSNSQNDYISNNQNGCVSNNSQNDNVSQNDCVSISKNERISSNACMSNVERAVQAEKTVVLGATVVDPALVAGSLLDNKVQNTDPIVSVVATVPTPVTTTQSDAAPSVPTSVPTVPMRLALASSVPAPAVPNVPASSEAAPLATITSVSTTSALSAAPATLYKASTSASASTLTTPAPLKLASPAPAVPSVPASSAAPFALVTIASVSTTSALSATPATLSKAPTSAPTAVTTAPPFKLASSTPTNTPAPSKAPCASVTTTPPPLKLISPATTICLPTPRVLAPSAATPSATGQIQITNVPISYASTPTLHASTASVSDTTQTLPAFAPVATLSSTAPAIPASCTRAILPPKLTGTPSTSLSSSSAPPPPFDPTSEQTQILSEPVLSLLTPAVSSPARSESVPPATASTPIPLFQASTTTSALVSTASAPAASRPSTSEQTRTQFPPVLVPSASPASSILAQTVAQLSLSAPTLLASVAAPTPSVFVSKTTTLSLLTPSQSNAKKRFYSTIAQTESTALTSKTTKTMRQDDCGPVTIEAVADDFVDDEGTHGGGDSRVISVAKTECVDVNIASACSSVVSVVDRDTMQPLTSSSRSSGVVHSDVLSGNSVHAGRAVVSVSPDFVELRADVAAQKQTLNSTSQVYSTLNNSNSNKDIIKSNSNNTSNNKGSNDNNTNNNDNTDIDDSNKHKNDISNNNISNNNSSDNKNNNNNNNINTTNADTCGMAPRASASASNTPMAVYSAPMELFRASDRKIIAAAERFAKYNGFKLKWKLGSCVCECIRDGNVRIARGSGATNEQARKDCVMRVLNVFNNGDKDNSYYRQQIACDKTAFVAAQEWELGTDAFLNALVSTYLEKTDTPCAFFTEGTCNRGEKCPYSHELGQNDGNTVSDSTIKIQPELCNTEVKPCSSNQQEYHGVRNDASAIGTTDGHTRTQQSNTPCSFFAEGTCDRGEKCPYSHEFSLNDASDSAVKIEPEVRQTEDSTIDIASFSPTSSNNTASNVRMPIYFHLLSALLFFAQENEFEVDVVQLPCSDGESAEFEYAEFECVKDGSERIAKGTGQDLDAARSDCALRALIVLNNQAEQPPNSSRQFVGASVKKKRKIEIIVIDDSDRDSDEKTEPPKSVSILETADGGLNGMNKNSKKRQHWEKDMVILRKGRKWWQKAGIPTKTDFAVAIARICKRTRVKLGTVELVTESGLGSSPHTNNTITNGRVFATPTASAPVYLAHPHLFWVDTGVVMNALNTLASKNGFKVNVKSTRQKRNDFEFECIKDDRVVVATGKGIAAKKAKKECAMRALYILNNQKRQKRYRKSKFEVMAAAAVTEWALGTAYFLNSLVSESQQNTTCVASLSSAAAPVAPLASELTTSATASLTSALVSKSGLAPSLASVSAPTSTPSVSESTPAATSAPVSGPATSSASVRTAPSAPTSTSTPELVSQPGIAPIFPSTSTSTSELASASVSALVSAQALAPASASASASTPSLLSVPTPTLVSAAPASVSALESTPRQPSTNMAANGLMPSLPSLISAVNLFAKLNKFNVGWKFTRCDADGIDLECVKDGSMRIAKGTGRNVDAAKWDCAARTLIVLNNQTNKQPYTPKQAEIAATYDELNSVGANYLTLPENHVSNAVKDVNVTASGGNVNGHMGTVKLDLLDSVRLLANENGLKVEFRLVCSHPSNGVGAVFQIECVQDGNTKIATGKGKYYEKAKKLCASRAMQVLSEGNATTNILRASNNTAASDAAIGVPLAPNENYVNGVQRLAQQNSFKVVFNKSKAKNGNSAVHVCKCVKEDGVQIAIAQDTTKGGARKHCAILAWYSLSSNGTLLSGSSEGGVRKKRNAATYPVTKNTPEEQALLDSILGYTSKL